MKIWRTVRWAFVAMATWGLVGTAAASAQDNLAKAKSVYASAGYEEALTILDNIRSTAPATDAEEIQVYQVFCLMALGRTDQARKAIDTIVHTDPLYHPTADQASPRVVAFFEDVRKPLLPQIVRDNYAKAKTDFDQKDMTTAVTEFDRVIALIDDMAAANDTSVSDLRTLASGFRDLAKSSIAPPPAPEPVAAAPSAGPSASTVAVAVEPTTTASAPAPTTGSPTDVNRIYSALDSDVKAPVALAHDTPIWNPSNNVEKRSSYAGVLEVVVDEMGNVTSATMRTATVASYDALLLKAAASWHFKPATRNGTPVKYRVHMSVQLGRQ